MGTENKLILLVVVADRHGNYRLSTIPFLMEFGERVVTHRFGPPEQMRTMQQELREEMYEQKIDHVANLTTAVGGV